jgi:hypothetical protein
VAGWQRIVLVRGRVDGEHDHFRSITRIADAVEVVVVEVADQRRDEHAVFAARTCPCPRDDGRQMIARSLCITRRRGIEFLVQHLAGLPEPDPIAIWKIEALAVFVDGVARLVALGVAVVELVADVIVARHNCDAVDRASAHHGPHHGQVRERAREPHDESGA